MIINIERCINGTLHARFKMMKERAFTGKINCWSNSEIAEGGESYSWNIE